MPAFDYLAMNYVGQPQRGKIRAEGRQEALNRLRSRGWIVVQLRSLEAEPGPIEDLQPVLTRRERILFFLQLSLLLRSGLDVIKSLLVVGESEKNSGLHWTCQFIVMQLEKKGKSLSSALRLLPESFSPMMVGLVRIGEETGALNAILNGLATRLEKRDRIGAQLTQSLIYPIFLTLATIILMVVLMTVLVPQVATVVGRADQSLPLLTQALLWVCSPLAAKLTLVLLLLLTIATVWIGRRSDRADIMDRLSDRLGLVRELKRKARAADFCAELAFMVSYGIPLERSLRLLTEQASPRSSWGQVLAHAHQTLMSQGDLQTALEHPMLPPVIAQMAMVGSETGQIHQGLGYCAELLENELELEVERLLLLLEPLLIAGCGVFSGVVCVAAFLPIYGLLNGVGT